MKEAAYQYFKIAKFKHMIDHVIRLQKAYRAIVFRRIVRRALMDTAWEKFVDEQKMIAQRHEFLQKRMSTLRKGKTVELAAMNAPSEATPPEAILKLR